MSSFSQPQKKMIIKEILPYSNLITLEKGEALKIRDESSHDLYYIDSGKMDISYTLDGTKVIVAVLGEQEFFGEIGFFDGVSRVRNITATKNTLIKVFSRDLVTKMQQENSDLYGRFITFLAAAVCKKFRRILGETEPLKAYATSLSTGAQQFVESQPLPPDFFNIQEGRHSNLLVEELKAKLFNISLRLQKDESDQIPDETLSEFNSVMDTFFDALAIFNTTLKTSKYEKQVWGYLFKETFPYFMRGALAERAYFKPNGYAGDFQMIEMMYRNKPCGDGKIGKLVDTWLLNRPPCAAVRGRRHFLAQKLLEFSEQYFSNLEKINIMNLACGPSRELFDFIKSFDRNERINAFCLDIDPEALRYTDELSKEFKHQASINLLKDNLIKWALGTSTQTIEPQNIIYSGGLFDYLNDDLFLMLVNRCYENLNPGGILMVGNFRDNPDRLFMDHLLEWQLIYREAEDLSVLFEKSLFKRKAEIMAEDKVGIQLFAVVFKD